VKDTKRKMGKTHGDKIYFAKDSTFVIFVIFVVKKAGSGKRSPQRHREHGGSGGNSEQPLMLRDKFTVSRGKTECGRRGAGSIHHRGTEGTESL
jgi:hypothetical protein